MKKWLSTLALLLLLAPRAWGGGCTITGQVFNPDGTPLANGTVQFNSVVQQTLQGGVTIPPTQISTTTDAQGNIQAISIIGGLQGQFVFCSPAAGGCGNPTPVLIPVAATADISAILIGIQLAAGGNINADNLNLTGNATIAGTLAVTGATTLNTLTLTGKACFQDLGCWDNLGISHVTHVGIGAWPATTPVLSQTGETAIVSDTNTDALGTNIDMTYISGVHGSASAWIADVTYPMWFTQASNASNGAEQGWAMYGPQTIGQPMSASPARVQYMALRANIPSVTTGGLFLESGGLDIIGGGATFNGNVYVQSGGLQVSAGGITSNQGITIQSGGLTATGGISVPSGSINLGAGNIAATWNQNATTIIQVNNFAGTGASSTAVVEASNGPHVIDMAMPGGAWNPGILFFGGDRGYVASNGANGLLLEATGAGAGAIVYLSAPNANQVTVLGNAHFGVDNDGVSRPSANAASCGGSGAVYSNATDTVGDVNIGPTASNSCQVTFAAGFNGVSCLCTARANTWCSLNPSQSGFTMAFGTPITGYVAWICMSHN